MKKIIIGLFLVLSMASTYRKIYIKPIIQNILETSLYLSLDNKNEIDDNLMKDLIRSTIEMELEEIVEISNYSISIDTFIYNFTYQVTVIVDYCILNFFYESEEVLITTIV